MVNRPQTFIGTYVRRGKLIEKNGKIDIENPVNAQWVSDFMVKPLGSKPEPKPKKEKPAKTPKKNGKQKEIPEFSIALAEEDIIIPNTIDGLKKFKEVKKLETENKLREIELEKKKGRILPLDFVIDWSGRNLRGIFGEAVNFSFTMIEQICFELDADTETQLKFKKKFKQGLSEVIAKGIKDQEPEALEFAKEYSLNSKW
jgi:hypothetical protein